jgi:hypothetical protein
VTEEVGWAEVTDDNWAPQFTATQVGVIVRMSGQCPRCEHQTITDFSPVIPGRVAERAADQPVLLFCKCGHNHEGHPDGDNSCGAYWTIKTKL